MNPLSLEQGPVHVEVELNQWRNRSQLDALQLDRLNALLKHAVERTPFHRARLGSRNGKAPVLRSLADFSQIPILTKQEIQANLDGLTVEGANRSEWIKDATGGSTGEPLVFYRDRRAQRWVEAATERFRRWFGCVPMDKLALIWGADRDFPPHIPPHERWLNVFNCRESDIERFILELVAWNPRTIRGYAGSLHLVAQFIKSRGLPKVHPNAIESAAETLTESMRQDIQEAFGAPVFNFYGSREIPSMACEDELHDGLLVADDVRFVEVIRDGKPAGPGEEGKLVITDLVNYAMPLIRYEIGDVAVVPGEPIPKHTRAFTRIQRILGRTANTITAPDGRLVHGEFFTHLFYHKPGIRNFQVRQHADASIDIQVVPGPGFEPAALERVIGVVREHLGPKADVRCDTVEEIATTRTGKRLFTISELPIRFDGSNPIPTATPPLNAPPHAPSRALTSSGKARILLLVDRPGQSQDRNAHALASALSSDFDFRIDYVAQKPNLGIRSYDLLVPMSWNQDYHDQFKPDPCCVLKLVDNYRWALDDRYGRLTPGTAVNHHFADAGALVVPSQRLLELLAPFRPTFLAPLGLNSAAFDPERRPSGSLKVGWLGDKKDPLDGWSDILLPAVLEDIEWITLDEEPTSDRMLEFYQAIDVLCVTSTADGSPQTLMEGLGCGCFPVAVNVGAVPELVRHRDNGLVVERRPEAFQAALRWCHFNLDWLRETAAKRSANTRQERAWPTVAKRWHSAFANALHGACPKTPAPKPSTPLTPVQKPKELQTGKHQIISIDSPAPAILSAGKERTLGWTPELVTSFWAYQARTNRTEYFAYQVGGNVLRGLRDYFPKAVSALDYGAGLGFLTEKLLEEGFTTTAADISPESVADIRARFSNHPRFAGGFTVNELIARKRRFQAIFITEVVEHVYDDALSCILNDVKSLLSADGIAVFTTPNDENLRNSIAYCPCCNHEFHKVQHVRNWNMRTLSEQMRQAGFEVVDVFATDFRQLPLVKIRHEGPPKLLHLVCLVRLSTARSK